MSIVWLDLETTGLNVFKHSVWEMAYAIGDGDIQSCMVKHSTLNADPRAFEVNNYYDRTDETTKDFDSSEFEAAFMSNLRGATVAGANPQFDVRFLEQRWGWTPWHHRLLDVEAYAMPYMKTDVPPGLSSIYTRLRDDGFMIPEHDHTAAADVDAVRECYRALLSIYNDVQTW